MEWHLEPHLSRCCNARVVSSVTAGVALYRCTCCGDEAAGADPAVICACGATVGTSKRDAGLRCMTNPKRTPHRPAEVEVVALSRYEAKRKNA